MLEYFYKALDEAGIERPRQPLPENGYLRWGHNARYWAIKTKGVEGVSFGDWQNPECNRTVFEKEERSLTPEDRRQRAKVQEEAQKAYKEEEKKRQKEAAERASSLWRIAPSIPENYNHPYLTRKKVKAYGLKLDDGQLVIPLYEASGKISSLQYIDGSGKKRFMSEGKKKGCYFPIGTPREEIIICEGYATGASIHEATGKAVAVAFDCGNLEAVTVALKNKYPDKEIILAADNDEKEGAPNRGVEEAQKVADKYSCKIIIPKLSKGGKADFNDIAVEEGLNKVASFFNKEEKEENPVLKGESDREITGRITGGNKTQTEANNPENKGEIRARVEGLQKPPDKKLSTE